MATLTVYLPGLDTDARQVRWLKRGSCRTHSYNYWQVAQQALIRPPVASAISAAQAMACYDKVWAPGEWLVLEPMQLTVDLVHVYYLQSAPMALSADERAALMATLQPYFADYGLALVESAAGRWYLHSQEFLQITTFAPPQFLGKSIRDFFPCGLRQSFWRRVLTELQMMMATHPVNIQRRQRGAPTVDCLWLWGEGASLSELQSSSATSIDLVCSTAPEILGLAQSLGIAVQADSLSKPLLQLHQQVPLASSQFWSDPHALQNKEQIMPVLHAALRHGLIDALTLYPNLNQSYYFKRQDLAPWKVWKSFSFS